MLKSTVKSIVLKTFPEIWYTLSSCRFHLLCRKRFAGTQDKFEKILFPDQKITVLSGPFKGMKYFNRIVWGPITPKWIGSYEEELHGVLGEISKSSYDTIVDVGTAEGYYAVGLSLIFPSSTVYAFDIDPIARRRQAELANLNGVSNLIIGKSCSHETLMRTLESASLLICDIEGFEYELIDPASVPKLTYTDILVEIHDFMGKSAIDVKDSLISRFTDSHSITVITSASRVLQKYRLLIPQFADRTDEEIFIAMYEDRPGSQEWLWMKSNGRA